jgi:hypothetical protein
MGGRGHGVVDGDRPAIEHDGDLTAGANPENELGCRTDANRIAICSRQAEKTDAKNGPRPFSVISASA